MIHGRLGDGRLHHGSQLRQAGFGILFPGCCSLQQFSRQVFQHTQLLQCADGGKLLLGCFHHLGNIGIVAIAAAIDLVVHFLFQFRFHNAHRRHMGTQKHQKIRDQIALLDVQYLCPTPGRQLGIETQNFVHQYICFPCHCGVGGGDFQVVALARIGHAAASQKCTAKECCLTAFLLHNGQIHMKRHRIAGIKAIRIHNGGNFHRILDQKQLLAGSIPLRQTVEGKIERFFEKLGQHGSKFPAFGNDTDAVHGKAVGEQQNTETLRLGAAILIGNRLADLCLGSSGK